MSTVEVHVPDIGDFDAVEVIEVLVAAGDQIAEEDSLITVESDKASMEIPSPVSGTVQSVNVAVGDTVSQGSLIFTVATDGAAAAPKEEPAVPAAEAPKAEAPVETAAAPAEAPKAASHPPEGFFQEIYRAYLITSFRKIKELWFVPFLM